MILFRLCSSMEEYQLYRGGEEPLKYFKVFPKRWWTDKLVKDISIPSAAKEHREKGLGVLSVLWLGKMGARSNKMWESFHVFGTRRHRALDKGE